MLSKSAVTAVKKVGLVNQRAFSLCRVMNSEVVGAFGVEDAKSKTIDLRALEPSELTQEIKDEYFPQIGNRDIVGPSHSVNYDYFDTPDFPMPSVRFASNTPEVLALRKKEKGDWKQLTLEEKKQLYRNTFCQTYAEMTAPTADWKRITALFFYTIAASILLFLYNVTYYGRRPVTYDREHHQAMLASMLMKNVGRYSGVSSKYDFEKNEWKK